MRSLISDNLAFFLAGLRCDPTGVAAGEYAVGSGRFKGDGSVMVTSGPIRVAATCDCRVNQLGYSHFHLDRMKRSHTGSAANRATISALTALSSASTFSSLSCTARSVSSAAASAFLWRSVHASSSLFNLSSKSNDDEATGTCTSASETATALDGGRLGRVLLEMLEAAVGGLRATSCIRPVEADWISILFNRRLPGASCVGAAATAAAAAAALAADDADEEKCDTSWLIKASDF